LINQHTCGQFYLSTAVYTPATDCKKQKHQAISTLISPFFLSLTSSATLVTTGTESYCCIWAHSMTHAHKHSVGLLRTGDQPSQRHLPDKA